MDFDMIRALAQLQLVGFLLLSAVSAFAQGGVTLRRPTPPTVKRNFVAASVHALPGLHCQLYPAGATPSSGVTVFTDDDGFARFHAVRAAAGDAVRQLILSCTDAEGKASTYPSKCQSFRRSNYPHFSRRHRAYSERPFEGHGLRARW